MPFNKKPRGWFRNRRNGSIGFMNIWDLKLPHRAYSRIWAIWLVVATHLKNIGKNGNLPQIQVKMKNI